MSGGVTVRWNTPLVVPGFVTRLKLQRRRLQRDAYCSLQHQNLRERIVRCLSPALVMSLEPRRITADNCAAGLAQAARKV